MTRLQVAVAFSRLNNTREAEAIMLAPMMPLRPALRAMWTRPQLSLVAVALLALGIGANTTLFALADAVMFRPSPFAEQDRLVIGAAVHAGRRPAIPYPDLIDRPPRAHRLDHLPAMG